MVAAALWVVAAVIPSEPGPEPLPSGRFADQGVLTTDVVGGRFGDWALVETSSGTVLLSFRESPNLVRGDLVDFEGASSGSAGRIRGWAYRTRVNVNQIERTGWGGSLPLHLGNAVRHRVIDQLAPFDDGRALLAGFLIGETSELDPADIEAMRLSGLSHFVAVSGSNVALFLLLLSLAAGPLALNPKRRALIGLLGLPVYAAATRFEPSVLRASVMAGIALAGQLFGLVLEAWQLLAVAVSVLVVLDPSITANIGFQLSVAATAGVMVGARWPVGHGRIARALAVALGAQFGVAPILILHFGTVPLFSPLINLVAAPLVTVATLVGAVGAAGFGWLTGFAALFAELVLMLARTGSSLPQVGWVAMAGLMVASTLALVMPRSRLVLSIGVAVLAVVTLIGAGRTLPDPGVVVLDIGQGDAILVHGGGGRVMLIDGGPDPIALLAKLREYRVTSIDVVVLSHVHADHVTGLTGLLGKIQIGEVWVASGRHQTPAFRQFDQTLSAAGQYTRTPVVGETIWLGAIEVTVHGPRRRYASPNDESIVLTLAGPTRTMLMTGDIEVVAQRELSELRANVLKVPHQGAATSDPEWLLGVGADTAIISVGPNQFGHPAPWVVDLFEGSNTDLFRTDLDGDVAVGL